MRTRKSWRIVFYWIVLPALSGLADQRQVALELLELDPPPRDWRQHLSDWVEAGHPLPPLPPEIAESPDKPPPDSASPQEHLKFWDQHFWPGGGLQPTKIARRKLLTALLENPAALEKLIHLLPQNRNTAERLSAIYDMLPTGSYETDKSRRKILAWIYEKSGLRKEEVLAEARNLDWEDYFDRITPLRALEADLEDSILREFAEGEDPGLAFVGNASLSSKLRGQARSHPTEENVAEFERCRERLQKLAANSEIPDEVREKSVEWLLNEERVPWNGREEWILQHLSLDDPGELNWFAPVIQAAPDRWIPKLAGLLNGPSRNLHNRAAALLSDFHLEDARADALKPLLPWIADPKWADASYLCRLRLIQSTDRLEFPEAVPGLIAAAEFDEGFELSDGATALAHYGAGEAVPVLKKAITRESDSHHRRKIIVAIHKLNGFSAKEIARHVEAYYRFANSEGGKAKLKEANDYRIGRKTVLPADVSIGNHYRFALEENSGATRLLEKRYRKLAKSEPTLAGQLRLALIRSGGETGQRLLAEQLESGSITLQEITAALKTEKETPTSPALQKIAGGADYGAGYAAVFARDAAAANRILEKGDAESRIALLAAARLIRHLLPLVPITKLLESDNQILQSAATLYLESEDSTAARTILAEQRTTYQKPKGKRASWDPGHFTFRHFDDLETQLQNDVGSPDGPEEVWALLSSGYWGGSGHWLVYVKDGKGYAVRDYERGRIGRCELSNEQLEGVRRYVEEYKVDELPPLELPIHDGIQYNFVHATPGSMRRVFMNNPPTSHSGIREYGKEGEGLVVYGQLVNLFTDLFANLEFEIGYGDGIEIVVPREEASIEAVWKQGDDFRVLVSNQGGSPYWAKIQDGQLGGVVAEPDGVEILASTRFLPASFEEAPHMRSYPWHSERGSFQIRSGKFNDQQGLWRITKKEKPECLFDTWCARPVVSPDGKWCLAAHVLGSSWSDPNGVLRLNLEAGEQFPIELEPADEFDVVAFVDAHEKFLVMRRRDYPAPGIEPDTGPEKPEFHLIDPETGTPELVAGEFSPLSHQTFRPLQSTGEPGVFWAAHSRVDDDGEPYSVVSRYSTKQFESKPQRTIRGLMFSSMDMWVDEPNKKILVAVNGDLVVVSLDEP